MWLPTPRCLLLCCLFCHTPQSPSPFCSRSLSFCYLSSHSSSLMAIPFYFFPPLLSFPHSTVCASLSVCLPAYLFLSLPQPFYVVSSLSFCLSQQCLESTRSWLTKFLLCLSVWEKRKLRVRNQERCFSHCALDSAASPRRHADTHTHIHSHTNAKTKNTVIESSPGQFSESK